MCSIDWDVLPKDGVKFSDVQQGDFGTCYFLAALISIAHTHPEVIENMFVHDVEWNQNGPVYTTDWNLDGLSIRVSVDDWIPVDEKTSEPRFTTYNDGYDFWPLILEKSWAKMFGNFHAIEFGYAAEAFKGITQAPVDIMELHRFTPEGLLTALQNAIENTYPMYAQSKEFPENGIASNHGYSILEVAGSSGSVKLYNPWNLNQYNGDLADSSSALSMTRGQNTGDFSMTLEEFRQSFDYVSIAHVRPNYVLSAIDVPRQHRRIRKRLEFTMKFDDPFAVQLEWPNMKLLESVGCRELRPRVQITVQLLGSDAGSVVAKRTSLQRYHAMSNIRADLPGGAGTYAVSVDFDLNDDWVKGIVVNTYARERTAIRVVQDRSAGPGSVRLENLERINECQRVVDRLHDLDNAEQIRASSKGVDPTFPPERSSLTPNDGTCDETCLSSGVWRRFSDIMLAKTRRKVS